MPKIILTGQSDITTGKVFILHVADHGLIPATPI